MVPLHEAVQDVAPGELVWPPGHAVHDTAFWVVL